MHQISKSELPELPDAPNQIRIFRSFFLMGIDRLNKERRRDRVKRSAYPDRVCALLEVLTCLMFGQEVNLDRIVSLSDDDDEIWLHDFMEMVNGVPEERAPLAERIVDVTKCISSVRSKLNEALDATWNHYAHNRWKDVREGKVLDPVAQRKSSALAERDLKTRSDEERDAMRKERNFRFFGELVIKASEWLTTVEPSRPKQTQDAIRTFLTAYSSFSTACKTIGRDRYLRRALPDPQSWIFEYLADEILPDLAENLKTTDLAKLYPASGVNDGLFAREVAVETADLLIRCFGHARPDVIRSVVQWTLGESLSPEDKQVRLQIDKAKKRIEMYAAGRRLPTADYPDGFVEKPVDPSCTSLSTSYWLGETTKKHKIKPMSTHRRPLSKGKKGGGKKG